MMRKYAFHPADYAIGENEKFYSDMADKGWKLLKRGTHLSRFEKSEPEKVLYRIEVAAAGIFDDNGMPDEKIAVFQECGWEYVTGTGYIHVFRAPEGSGAPEFYMEPQQQALTLKKLRRSYILSLFWLAFFCCVILIFDDTRSISMSFCRALIRHTAYILFLAAVISGGVLEVVYGCFRTAQLYRRLKRGKEIDHSPNKRRLVYKSMTWAFAAIAALGLVLTAAELISYRNYDMPTVSDGPYITLAALGYEGERGYVYNSSETSRTKYARSLAAEYWNTYECLILDNGDVWLYQDVYELRLRPLTYSFALALMEDSTLARGIDGYSKADIPGFESAYISEYEAVAIKGSCVVHIVYFPPDHGGYGAVTGVLEAVARQVEL